MPGVQGTQAGESPTRLPCLARPPRTRQGPLQRPLGQAWQATAQRRPDRPSWLPTWLPPTPKRPLPERVGACDLGTLGGTRTPNLLIRRHGRTVQDRPMLATCWADSPGLSSGVGSWLWPWQQFWQQPNRSGSAIDDGVDHVAEQAQSPSCDLPFQASRQRRHGPPAPPHRSTAGDSDCLDLDQVPG